MLLECAKPLAPCGKTMPAGGVGTNVIVKRRGDAVPFVGIRRSSLIVEPMASVSQLKMFPSSSISNAQQCLAVCHFIRKDQQCRCRERLHRGRLLRIDLRLSTTGAQCSFVNTVQHEQALQFKPSKSAVMKTGQEKWLTDDSDCRISDLVEHSSAYLRLPRAEDVCWISQARPSIRSREMPYQFGSSSYQARP